jgi:hypothetical protein
VLLIGDWNGGASKKGVIEGMRIVEGGNLLLMLLLLKLSLELMLLAEECRL